MKKENKIMKLLKKILSILSTLLVLTWGSASILLIIISCITGIRNNLIAAIIFIPWAIGLVYGIIYNIIKCRRLNTDK